MTVSYRFFDSRYVFGKTPNELNKYISLLKKNNYTSISSCDYSYEVRIVVVLHGRSSIVVPSKSSWSSSTHCWISSPLGRSFRRGVSPLSVLRLVPLWRKLWRSSESEWRKWRKKMTPPKSSSCAMRRVSWKSVCWLYCCPTCVIHSWMVHQIPRERHS